MLKLTQRFFGLALLSSLAACIDAEPDATTADATTDDTAARDSEISRPGSLVAMTRNQYLGADLTGIATSPDAAAFNRAAIAALDQIAANRFPERALSLALEIALRRPDVIGLQEVEDFKRDGAHGAPPYRDHLADTLQALALLGQHYVVAAQVLNASTQIPVDFDGDGVLETIVEEIDRDVILVRKGLTATPVPFSAVCARPSLDGGPGCNFQLVVTAPTPVGDLVIQRGFVGIDVTVNGRAYRVVNTHLEVPDLDPTNPLSPVIQAVQAQELTGILAATSPADRTLVVLGDLNSGPDEQIITVGGFTIVPPYIQMAAAGFIDSWLVDPRVRPGFTCCQAADLRNPRSLLNERIDLILTRETPAAARDELVGAHPIERTPITRLWPSDHAGVIARLQF